MNILAFDIGKHTGVAFNDEWSDHFEFKSLSLFKKKVSECLDTWKPDMVISCKPNRFYNTVFTHGKMMGIIELCCEQSETQYFEFYDPEVKKLVFGTGKIEKEAVMEKFGGETQDEADARMFCEFGKLKFSKST